ncbi:hypothetical protein GQ53DRAFT_832865 [Thozetella sp. PMI_491]|nr:hypothetical protein GQ53DRAFT_832865 [Thozetella sp. PMI_491]
MPWQIPWIRTHSPPFLPTTNHNSSVSFNVIDPNTINAVPSTTYPNPLPKFFPTSVNCSIEWDSRNDAPYDVVWPCGLTDSGNWTFQILHTHNESEWQSATDQFILRLNLKEALAYNGSTYSKAFVAEQFIGGEILAGSCGGSGVCNWHLRPRHTPLLITQNMTSCEGDCYMDSN